MNKIFFSHPLMQNNITKKDLDITCKFLKKNPILTQSAQVEKFEKIWSRWLGVKYSVFVNSGSSANFLSLKALKIYQNKSDEILVPTLTWNSDIVSVIENGFKPIFVDISLNNLSMDENDLIKKINKNTQAIFITHAQGFNGLTDRILKKIKEKNITLIEDVCESHGAKFKNRKLGTFGLISNFSFYYAHHLSTIEGGMICTNSKKIFEICRMLRGHGLLREAKDKKFKQYLEKKHLDLSKDFIFMYPGYNMRNNEISAVIGINGIKRLDENNKKRSKNFLYFLKNLNHKFFYKDFYTGGSSNYAFPLILNKDYVHLKKKLENVMEMNQIEFRRGNAGGGNQLRQPYLKNYLKKLDLNNFPNVEHVHFYGYYIGNYPELKLQKIKKITEILNSIDA
jgi:CDP-6-deoxy-D-xylo-4-hexulose-3-dehydrase